MCWNWYFFSRHMKLYREMWVRQKVLISSHESSSYYIGFALLMEMKIITPFSSLCLSSHFGQQCSYHKWRVTDCHRLTGWSLQFLAPSSVPKYQFRIFLDFPPHPFLLQFTPMASSFLPEGGYAHSLPLSTYSLHHIPPHSPQAFSHFIAC